MRELRLLVVHTFLFQHPDSVSSSLTDTRLSAVKAVHHSDPIAPESIDHAFQSVRVYISPDSPQHYELGPS